MIKKPGNNRKCNFIWLLLALLFNVTCSNSPKQPIADKAQNAPKDSILQKPPGSYPDSLIINYPVAVFYYPDSLQLEKIKAMTDSVIFESTMHELFYQMRNSRIVLHKTYPQLKIVDAKNVRFLLFKPAVGKNHLIDLNSKNDPYGLIVSDGHKSPRLLDMTNIESELGFYFTK